MTEFTNESKFHKAGFDSRIPFSNLLVKLREVLLYSTDDYNLWLRSLRIYYSNVKGYIKPEEADAWLKAFEKVLKDYNVSRQNKSSYYNPEVDIFKLQDKIFDLTAGLYLPLNDEDDDDNEDW